MTRKSKRDLARDLDALDTTDADTVEEWVREYIDAQDTIEWGVKVQFVDDDGDVSTQIGGESENVLIGIAGVGRYYAPPGDVPRWITPDGDLPVKL